MRKFSTARLEPHPAGPKKSRQAKHFLVPSDRERLNQDRRSVKTTDLRMTITDMLISIQQHSNLATASQFMHSRRMPN
jgi:hypothetical protein